jgi:hypothetical protein
MEISDPRSARQLANTLQSRQGTASVVDKATGAVVFRPPWLQPGKPLKRRAPRAH